MKTTYYTCDICGKTRFENERRRLIGLQCDVDGNVLAVEDHLSEKHVCVGCMRDIAGQHKRIKKETRQ